MRVRVRARGRGRVRVRVWVRVRVRVWVSVRLRLRLRLRVSGRDDHVRLAEVCGPRGHVVRQTHHAGEVLVALVLGEPLLLELAWPARG